MENVAGSHPGDRSSAAVYLVIVTTVFGWWRPADAASLLAGSPWMWAIPVLLLVGAVLNLGATQWGEIDDVGTYVFWLGLGCLSWASPRSCSPVASPRGGRGSMHEP